MNRREIKFRAWDGKKKLMVEGKDFYISTNVGAPAVVMIADPYLMPLFEQIDEIYLMQYTGLKDTAGKEIYEGDIVEIDKQETEKFKMNPTRQLVEYGGNRGSARFHPFWLAEGEIIGNIYENPELLKNV